MSAYGMDGDGDGVLSFEELQAYEAFKAQKKAEAQAAAAAAAAAQAAGKAAMQADYDTVPGFAARRGYIGNTMNDHNYGEPLSAEKAVFKYNKLTPGKMAQMLARPVDSSGPPMEPRGRARTNGGGGIEGQTEFYEPDRLQTGF